MKPDLVGYVLNALDPAAKAGVESHLRADPQSRAEVEAIRQALEPLSWDKHVVAPPGLAERTLQRVAAVGTAGGGFAMGVAGMPWRRVLEVAAGLLVAVTALGAVVSWLGRTQVQQLGGEPNAVQLVACKNNLQKLYTSLCTYADAHGRTFPDAAAALPPPRSGGELVFAILHDHGQLPAGITGICPASDGKQVIAIGLNEVKAMNNAQYQEWLSSFKSGYAYSVGYRHDGQLVGPRLEDGKPASLMPLMADSAPPNPGGVGQSLNHGGHGQNVLYCDGHVAFCQSRLVGYQQDDIYLNRVKRVDAGVDWSDAVLSGGKAP